MKRALQVSISILLIAASANVYWHRLHHFEQLLIPVSKEEAMEVELAKEQHLFGLNVTGMQVEEGIIKWGQNISDILQGHNIPSEKLHELSKVSKPVFDVRKLAARRPYFLVCKDDTLHTAEALIYEPNAVEYVTFNLGDSIWVAHNSREITIMERTLSGIINSSLAESIRDAGGRPQLTNDFADVFAWEIDFFRLFPGDKFKVIYEEMIVDGKSVGIGKIIGGYFSHDGKASYAFYFDQDDQPDYFDSRGNSLRKALLKYPLKFNRISSRYTGRRYHPVLGRYKAHRGTDFAADRGTPIRTVGDGVVVEARYGQYNGNYVKIKHNGIYSTQYLHMSAIARGIRPGVSVAQGQTIGYVGSTGLARGNHLCFRFWKNGRQVDALKVDLPPSQPVRAEHKIAFNEVKSALTYRLDTITYQRQPAKLMARSF